MTKEEIREYINAHEELKKMLHRFMRHNDNIITSSLTQAEEDKLHLVFMNAYSNEINKLISKVDINSEAFKEYVKEEGITDFIAAKNMADGMIYDVRNNPLADPSITDAQRKGLEEFHRWLNRNCEKTGFMGDDEAGGMRDFANKFMSQPASVQLKALYLLETGKRKAPDEAGFDDFNSQMNYVPSLDKIKKPLIASPLKIWKRSNGSQFYWSKLNQSLKIAEKSAVKLERFRADLRRTAMPEQGEKNIKNYSKLNILNGISKLVEADKILVPDVNSKTKEVKMVKDGYTASNISSCKAVANMLDSSQANEKQKEKIADEALKNFAAGLPQFKYNHESTKTVKGAWEVGTDIIGQKENYQNLERLFKAALTAKNDNFELGNPPPAGIVAYLNNDNVYLKDLPSNLFDGLNLVGDVVEIVNAFVNLKQNINNTNGIQKLTGTLKFAANASDGLYHGFQMLMSASKTKAVSGLEGSFETFKDYSLAAGAVTGMLTVAKNAVVTTKQGLNRESASNAKMLANTSRKFSDDEKKRINDIADFSHLKSVKTQHGAIRGMIKGAGSLATSAGATALATVPVAGPVILAGVTGLSIYEQFKNRKDRKELARMAVDKLVTGTDRINEKVNIHSNRIQDRLRRYDDGDKTGEKLRKFYQKQNKIKDRTRNEEAVKAGHTSLFTCTGGATSTVADELLKKVYLINPDLDYTEGNIITDSREHAKYRRERTSYQELLESMGVAVKYKSKSEIKDVKKFKERIHEKKAAQLGS